MKKILTNKAKVHTNKAKMNAVLDNARKVLEQHGYVVGHLEWICECTKIVFNTGAGLFAILPGYITDDVAKRFVVLDPK